MATASTHRTAPLLLLVLLLTAGSGYGASADAPLAPSPENSTQTIRIGSDNNYPPYEFVDSTGKLTGFNVELIRAAARVTNLKTEFHPGSWSEIRKALESGRVDVATGMYYSDKRAGKFDFSVPHSIVYHSMFVRAGSGLSKIEDLRDNSIIVIDGDIMHDYALSLGFKKQVVVVGNHLEALRLLASGRHDGTLLSKVPALHIMEKYGITGIRAVGPLILPQEYCFAVPKADSALAARLDQGLSILKETGEYKKIRQQWFGVVFQERYGFIFQLAAWILGPALLLLFITWYWNRLLSCKVRERTEALSRELGRHRRTLCSLAKREEHLRALLESSSEAILSLDIHRTVTDCNPAFVRQFGYERDEIIGASIAAIHIDRDAYERFGRQIYPNIKLGGVWRGEWTYRHKEGARIPVDTSIAPKKGADGKHDGYVAIMRDITARKKAEAEEARLTRELSQAQKMEAVGTLAGGIAHDFGNILTSLIGYAEMALEDDLEPGSPARYDVEQILSGCHRAKELVEQILTFSAKSTSRPAPLHLTPLVKETLRLIKAGLPEQTTLTHDLDCKSDVVSVLPAKIYQLLFNLCTNGAQALEKEGGELRVEMKSLPEADACAIRGDRKLSGPCLCLTVSDNGHGMTPETLERIFEPYFTTRDISGGSGLGLSVVHGIVGSLGGIIDVASTPGSGSRFSVFIPQPPEQTPPAPGSSPDCGESSKRVIQNSEKTGG